MTKLTPKQDAFVKAYLLNGGNATQAAIDAGYSEKTAAVVGCENLTKPNIANSIKEHQELAKKSFIWSKEKKLEILQDTILACRAADADKGVVNGAVVVSALKEHNAMQGDNEPTKQDITIDDRSENDKLLGVKSLR